MQLLFQITAYLFCFLVTNSNVFFLIFTDDKPINEALKALGINNVKWDNFEVIKGHQRSWFCPIEKCDDVFIKLSSLKIHILTHYKLRPFKVNLLYNSLLTRHFIVHITLYFSYSVICGWGWNNPPPPYIEFLRRALR